MVKAATVSAPVKPEGNAQKGKLQQVNARHIRLLQQLRQLGEDVAAFLLREPERSPKDKSPNPREPLTQYVNAVEQGLKEVEEAGKFLERLAEMKWEPQRPGPRVYRAGDTVDLKEGVQERYTKMGAFKVEDLVGLKVISVHGENGVAVKVATKKGEGLGLVNSGWLRPHVEAQKS